MGSVYNSTMNDVVDPVEIVSSTIFLAIGIPTLFVYFRILSHFCNKGFKTQFHKLFLVCITNDMFAYLAQMFTIRLPTWGIIYPYRFIMNGAFPTFLNFSLGYTITVQVYGIFLMALNRATCIAFSYQHEKLWRNYFKFFLIALLVLPFISNFNLLVQEARFGQYGKGLFIIHSSSTPEFVVLHMSSDIVGIFSAFALNCYNGYHVFKHIKKKKSRSELKDLKFHFTTFFAWIVQVLMMCILIFIQLTKIKSIEGITELMYFVYTMQPVTNDLASLLPVWFMIYISEDFRWMACGSCGVGNRDDDGNTIVVSTQSLKINSNSGSHSNSDLNGHQTKLRVQRPTVRRLSN